ncbi:hypothetical protein IU501_30245 [Nocardia otitidiscaviarum]|nr:hypothetical protein [Nocardia otitidiscaviarum]MBF6488157.1 hypothetical protein [Nocardia otitidiscaviarum]
MSYSRGIHLVERIEAAFRLRDEWLRRGLSTASSDRAAAEGAISELYRLLGEPPPEFVWVPSPSVAAEVVRDDSDGPGDWRRPPSLDQPFRSWPFLQRFLGVKHELRRRLSDVTGADRRYWRREFGNLPDSWTDTPYGTALWDGSSIGRLLAESVHNPLRESLRDNMYRPLRTALLDHGRGTAGPAAYEQYDLWTVPFFDVYRAAGLMRYADELDHHLDQWATVARSAGWWWPGRRRCVISERPVAVHAEAQPGSAHGAVRLHHDERRAVEFADGSGVFALHGTFVPDWVLTAPTVDRILAERNIEVRRAAIERIGWDFYIEQAGLALVSTAPDPGNPGAELRLYDLPRRHRRERSRVLLVVNGSRERDGTRRRYGLNVPEQIADPLAAAGWSYGLTGTQYASLRRRT